jgi:hypothetical protein
MSAVHERWELVEPLLFAHSLRDPSAFRGGATKCSQSKDLEAIRREHRFEDTTIAQAFNLLGYAESLTLDRDEPLFAVLCNVSKRWLIADGDHWGLRIESRQPGHEIIRWRGVTMLVPPSIVVAGALSMTERLHPCRVQALPDSIAPLEPVGHLHVHLGPMLPFEALWLQLWNVFLQRGTLDARKGGGIAAIKEKDLPEIGRHASKRQPGMRWQWILELAFAARVWLLLDDKNAPRPSVLQAFSRGKIDLKHRAGALLRLWSQSDWRNGARREGRRLSKWRMRNDRRMQRFQASAVHTLEDNTDFAASTPNEADDEVVFLAKALERCGDDEPYARVLYQYLRVKVALYRQLVVDPWTVGLRHFLDVVQRDGPYTDVIDDNGRLEDMRLDVAWTEKPLRVGALEVHVPPKRWLKQPRRAPRLHAWVLSFVRAKPPKTDDPDGARAADQWRRAIAEAGTTCRLLARCIAMRPLALQEIRGLSLMDWERNGPVWLFEAPFRRLIEASAEVAAGHPRLRLRPLRTAFHLGEDFDHLLSGLRQISEPFEWGLIGRGDRIGHALALGLSPETWCERHPWVRMRPWDRMLDIGFVYHAFEHLGLSLPADALERMRASASEAVRQVFNLQDPHALETTRDIWQSLRHLPPRHVSSSIPLSDRIADPRKLLALVLDDRKTGRAALSLSLSVETTHDLPVLRAVHDMVLDCVAKWQVAVEVNPSSNLLVGGFRSVFHQPSFHTDDLPITLNADDPLTFGTTLADEYAYAWAGMVVGSGQSPHQATRRLEEAARCSMRYVFTDRSAGDARRKL